MAAITQTLAKTAHQDATADPPISAKPRTAPISQEAMAAFRARTRGVVLTNGEEGYDAARRVWNAMIDRRPGLIVRCAGAADVRAAVDFARNAGAVLAVRGGGHNIAGSAVCDGGVMIDLTPMKSVRVDPVARTARVEPGVTLGEFDRETQAFGLVTPTGSTRPRESPGSHSAAGSVGLAASSA
jgi:FAD/FMN-containing dehydrogenase